MHRGRLNCHIRRLDGLGCCSDGYLPSFCIMSPALLCKSNVQIGIPQPIAKSKKAVGIVM